MLLLSTPLIIVVVIKLRRINKFTTAAEARAAKGRKERKDDVLLSEELAKRLNENGFFDGDNNFLVALAGVQHTPSMRYRTMLAGKENSAPVRLVEHVPYTAREVMEQSSPILGEDRAKRSVSDVKGTFLGIKKRLGKRLNELNKLSPTHHGIIIGDLHGTNYSVDLPSPKELEEHGTKNVFVAFETDHAEAQQLNKLLDEGLPQHRKNYFKDYNPIHSQLLDFAEECKRHDLNIRFIGFDPRPHDVPGLFHDLLMSDEEWEMRERVEEMLDEYERTLRGAIATEKKKMELMKKVLDAFPGVLPRHDDVEKQLRAELEAEIATEKKRRKRDAR
jgi:hypothetical protein